VMNQRFMMGVLVFQVDQAS